MRFVQEIRWVKISNNASDFSIQIKEKSIFRITVGKKDICLTRYGDELFAFKNLCPHQLQPLNDGYCTDDKKIVCKWHRFAFDLHNGKGCNLALETYPLKTEENRIYIGFEETCFKFFG